MNKYIKAVFCVPLAAIKYAILKVENGKRFKASFPAVMSPLTEVTVEGKSAILICSYAVTTQPLLIPKFLPISSFPPLRTRIFAPLCIFSFFPMCNSDNVMLGPNVLIYDQDHDYRAEGGVAAMKFKTAPITIGNNVWIGANTLILRGTTIGDNCVIGAGCVVKDDISNGSVFVQQRNSRIIRGV